MTLLKKVVETFNQVHNKSPLVHYITNYVTVNDCANITLALGGSPVMADDIDEVEHMTSRASSLVINMGTLNTQRIAAMFAAGKQANSMGIPIVLDPVGYGAIKHRTDTAEKIITELRPTVIRGNMSEMKLLAGMNVSIKGVDSTANEEDGIRIAVALANSLSCVIAITGKRDIITSGDVVYCVDNGHEMLSKVTGAGCMTTSLIGTYCGTGNDYTICTLAGVVSMGIAGEKAQETLRPTEGIGTFRSRIFDNIYNLNADTILKRGLITIV